MPPRPPSYVRQWIVAGILLAAVIVTVVAVQRRQVAQRPHPPSLPATTNGVNWFLIARIPEAPPGQADAWLDRTTDWLRALRDENFVIMPLTEILKRHGQQQPLPERALALLFDPGYRYTFESITDTVERERIPMLWLTQEPGRFGTDRRFVSPRQRQIMADAPLWNVALQGVTEDVFILQTPDNPTQGEHLLNWHVPSGGEALNTAASLPHLHRLHAHPAWTTDEFLGRLYAEIPIERPVRLTAIRIRGKRWGITAGARQGQNARFDIETDPEQRSATVSWLGTRGCRDVRLDLAVKKITGELWILLRSDRESGNRLRLGILPDRFDVDVQQAGVHRRLASAPRTPSPGGSFEGTLHLQEDQLVLTQDGHPLISLNEIPVDGAPNGILEMVTYGMLRGTACARNIALTVTPLAPGPPVDAGGPP